MEKELIFYELSKLMSNAYAPYSQFNVASIVIGENDKKYYGVNIENASFGATICAERCAISNAIIDSNKKIKELYLLTSSNKFIYPCGICLQFISEFMDYNGQIYIFSQSKEYKVYKLSDLILSPFVTRDLKNE